MKHFILFTLFLLSVSQLYAQDSRWRLSVIAAPYAGNAHLFKNNGPNPEIYEKIRDERKTIFLHAAAGAEVRYSLSRRSSLTAGLYWIKKGYKYKEADMATMDGAKLGRSSALILYSFVELPITYQFHLMPDSRLRPYLSAGASAGYYVNYIRKMRSDYSGEMEKQNWKDNKEVAIFMAKDLDNYTPIKPGFQIGAGIQPHLGGKFDFIAESFFSFSNLSFAKKGGLTEWASCAGLKLGLGYNF